MKKFHGGDSVTKGYYFHYKKLDFVNIAEGGGILPGGADVTYIPVKTLRMLIAIVVISLVYVIFLPFAGIVIVGGTIALAIVVFLVQKGLCRVIRAICKIDSRLCDLFCQKCGIGCEEDFRMVWIAFGWSLIFLAGWFARSLAW